MDENQRQDWWPENFSNDFSRNPESSGQPQDTLQNTTQNSDFTDSLNEDRPSQEETYIPTAEPQQNQNDSYDWNNNQQQNQNDTYGWNNNQQQQNQGNPYGWNNSGNFNQPSGGPYYQQPPYRTSGNAMVAASLLMGIQFYNEYENDDDYYDGYDDYDDYGNYDDYDDFFNQFKDFEDFGNQSGGYSDDLSYQLPSPASSL